MSGEPQAAPASIRVLAPEVAARIAAGEVIERPVSVVRELLDNAIDAGARRIAIEVEDGGIGLIRVTDDGRGIVPDQVEIAFERHATSKIGSLGDLGSVRTLGFRGEALPSIAAAADVELVTRAASEPVGVAVTLVDARVARRAAKPAPVGTSFAVRELFARLPARRKFLGSGPAETRQVIVLVSHYALAYPGIAFALVANGRRALTTAGDGDLRHAFAAVYGAESGASMLAVDHEEEGVRVTGLAGPPALNRGNRAAISVFVNGRWVQSRPLTFAIVDAYQSQLPVGRHPMAALRVDLPSSEVDVNVHPAKAEVRFRDERAVARAVRHAVGAALEGSRPVAWGWGTAPEAEADAPGAFARPAMGATLRQRLEAPAPEALRGPEPVQPRLAWAPPGEETPRLPSPPLTQREVLPLLRVVGQMNATYVVCEGPDGIYLLDQHAAHERVNYDRIVRRERTAAASQPLLEPVLAELDAVMAVVMAENLAHLEALGLVVEPFGDGACLVRAVPAGIGGGDVAGALRALLEQIAQERRVADPFGRAAATVACHASVRAGMALSMEEMRRLVEDLERTPNPRTCPHGRPTLIHLGTEAIERQFGRR
ncbi:MAG: DNA mismatch repair endonuclease MutL [Dehalococcoidia bacterium]|nr:DNA mismatch repair endonuclease MutL [Dehalococcoidia bacterium]